MSAGARQSADRIYTLDGLRGVAAALVALYHFSHPLAPAGYIAVDLFFVMSGVVIAQAYTGRLQRSLKTGEFLRMRFVRLYPLYAVGLLIGLVVTTLQGILPLKQTFASLATNAFMLPAPLIHGGNMYPFNLASWSLFFELAINILFALWMFRSDGRRLVGMMLISAIALFAIAWRVDHLNVGVRITPEHVLGGTARVFYSFSAGILIYRWQQSRSRAASWTAALLMLITAGALVIPVPEYLQAGRDLTLVLIVSPLLVILAVRIDPPAVLVPLFRFLGDISYALYAVHLALVNLWLLALPHDQRSAWPSVAAYLLIVVSLAALLEFFFDKPVRLYLAQRRKRALPPVPQPV